MLGLSPLGGDPLGAAGAAADAGGGSFSVMAAGIASAAEVGALAVSFATAGAFSVSPAGLGSTATAGGPIFGFQLGAEFSVSALGVSSVAALGSTLASFQYGDSMEPVTVDEAKVAARVDVSELDDLIAGAITAARTQAEHITGRVYRRRTFRFELNDWPASDFRFSVFEPDACTISFFNEAGTWQALSDGAFEFAAVGAGAAIAPALDAAWPLLGRRALGARVRVTFTAGPASRDDVDEQVKLFIKASVAAWVSNPEAVQAKSLSESPLFERLLDAQRIYG